MEKLLKSVARLFNLEIMRAEKLQRLEGYGSEVDALFDEILRKNGGGSSRAQLKQDIFALIESGFKRDGFFVEFGATNGVDLSNTILLEREFGWQGILAEPARTWHEALRRNRNAIIETACVWTQSGQTLEFRSTDNGAFSTISAFSTADRHSAERQGGELYPVTTISLLDLLDKHTAPPIIDYLSIDTEGSEYDILSAFDFSKYRFGVITCEHNHTPMREKIRALLEANGYRRTFDYLSQFDDWYVQE